MKSFVDFLLKLQLFYDPSQTRRQMLKEFKQKLKEKTYDEVTAKTYAQLGEIDKAIIMEFAKHYRKKNNATMLSKKLGYSCDGIYYRLRYITNLLYNNTISRHETVDFEG